MFYVIGRDMGYQPLMELSLLIKHPNKSSSQRSIHRVCALIQTINKNIENLNMTIYAAKLQFENIFSTN